MVIAFNAVDIKYNTVSGHFEPDWCFIERPNGIIVRDVNNLVNQRHLVGYYGVILYPGNDSEIFIKLK